MTDVSDFDCTAHEVRDHDRRCLGQSEVSITRSLHGARPVDAEWMWAGRSWGRPEFSRLPTALNPRLAHSGTHSPGARVVLSIFCVFSYRCSAWLRRRGRGPAPPGCPVQAGWRGAMAYNAGTTASEREVRLPRATGVKNRQAASKQVCVMATPGPGRGLEAVGCGQSHLPSHHPRRLAPVLCRSQRSRFCGSPRLCRQMISRRLWSRSPTRRSWQVGEGGCREWDEGFCLRWVPTGPLPVWAAFLAAGV